METKFELTEAMRFLRTLRVATGVAVAREEMRHVRAAPAASFLALAAKTGEWSFPPDGLLSGDGLLLAKRTREADGSGALILQAQGAVGVTAYARREARVVVGEAWGGQGVFDRFGALRLALGAQELDDTALARFDVELPDGAP